MSQEHFQVKFAKKVSKKGELPSHYYGQSMTSEESVKGLHQREKGEAGHKNKNKTSR